MLYLIDAAAVLNSPGFSFSQGNFVTSPLVFDELRDLRSRHLAENALKNGLIRLEEAPPKAIAEIRALASEKGFSKLSEADVSLLALALELKQRKESFVLLTDDYSVQNFCKLLKIGFDSVIRGKIEKTISFKKRCTGCSKEFPGTFSKRVCPDCGSPIRSKKLG